jgi:hypothetical protein
VNRRSLPSVATTVLLAGAASLCLSAAAAASGGPQTATAQHTANPGRTGPGVHADGLQVHLTGASLTTAASRCARWAANAGFANNGYLAGSLTTAVAVALTESGCSTTACWDDTRHQTCSPRSVRRRDSVDRGAWQLNSKAWGSIPNSCAFSGQCAADAAYAQVSAFGTFFAPWTSYSIDLYAGMLWAAQKAVNALRQGKIASAVTGSCVGYPADRRGALVRLANCNSRVHQIWRIVGRTLRTPARLCLTATSRRRSAPVRLGRCTHTGLQEWQPRGGALLYNLGAHRCLADPGGRDIAGTVLATARCAVTRGEGWFRP